jgi:hypothetical protein
MQYVNYVFGDGERGRTPPATEAMFLLCSEN